jgi:hypothetical protein
VQGGSIGVVASKLLIGNGYRTIVDLLEEEGFPPMFLC